MGIPRLTTDLQPYLEDAIISKEAAESTAIVPVDKIVIDGPGMVYHVYNKLAAHKIELDGWKDIHDTPTYTQLCGGVDTFLTDLENYGAQIVHIYFDGALPQAKRSTRLKRLEKTLQQLGTFRLVYPNLKLESVNHTDEEKGSLSSLTCSPWRNETSSNANTGLPQLPFIVAAAREYLNTSRWSRYTSTVPGEADSYCATAAHIAQAAVLTNDSDLVLFEDMQTDGVIMLLNSLVKRDEPLNFSCIRGTCWRPSEIRRQLSLANLLSLAFERTEDPSCSFLTLMQRAKAPSHAASNAEQLAKFADQFKSEDLSRTSDAAIRDSRHQELDLLDPRLAELAVQLQHTHNHNMCPQADLCVNMYFPILHEDPNRDSSWSYGRRYRQLGYSLLYHYHISTHPSQVSTRGNSSTSVTEYFRKSHIVGQENVPMLFHHNLFEALKQCRDELQALSPLPPPYSPGTNRSKLHDKLITSRYILFALTDALHQRNLNGKPSPPQRLLAQLLGLSPFLTQRQRQRQRQRQQSSTRDHHHATIHTASGPTSDSNSNSNSNNDAWTLLHLNANVQAILYSLRILKQCIDYIVSLKPSLTQLQSGERQSGLPLPTGSGLSGTECFSTSSLTCPPSPSFSFYDIEIEAQVSLLRNSLSSMPGIAGLFLHPAELAAYLQTISLRPGDDNDGDDEDDSKGKLMREFCERTGVDLISFTTFTREQGRGGMLANYDVDVVFVDDDDDDNVNTQGQEKTRRRQKRRMKRRKENVETDMAKKRSTVFNENIFDVLGEEV